MRKLCYKVKIDAIEPIPDADRLEVARIGGWRSVVDKGGYHAGDIVLYFEIDSALNVHDERFAFLKERCLKQFKIGDRVIDQCLRIRSIKLRGVISQGLVLPLEPFHECRSMQLGEDCSALLGVRHFDEVSEGTRALMGKQVSPDQKGLFPAFLPKTDEERIQNIPQPDIDYHQDVPMEVSEKADGQSLSLFYAHKQRPEDPFGICSRNFELKPDTGFAAALIKKYDLRNKLEVYCQAHDVELGIQGELVGPGINGNRDMRIDTEWLVFRIRNITQHRWLNWDERYVLCKAMGLEHVPVIGVHTMAEFGCSRDEMLKFAEGTTANGNEREGLVWKSADGTFTFKTVSNRYLLKLK